jgi:ribose 5-phosphate isomerase B
MADIKTISIGSDHRGVVHKTRISNFLRDQGYEVKDFGCHGTESADYTDAALPAAAMVGSGDAIAGVLICGSGIGMSIAANKVLGVRASLCFTVEQARTTRQHNDSNVLCLSGDGIDPDTAVQLTAAWLESEFEGGRHARRVNKFIAWENEHQKQE